MRLFILSDSPPEKDVQWSDQGMSASYKFIQKFWLLHEKIKKTIKFESKNESKIFDEKLEFFTNQTIEKINSNLEKFSYNVIIANLYETYNFFSKAVDLKSSNFISNYIKILKIMQPIVPHLSSECLSEMNINEKILWPDVDSKYLVKEGYNIVVQINGKKRMLLSTQESLNQENLIKKIKEIKEIQKYLENKDIFKCIFIKNKLINFIIK